MTPPCIHRSLGPDPLCVHPLMRVAGARCAKVCERDECPACSVGRPCAAPARPLSEGCDACRKARVAL